MNLRKFKFSNKNVLLYLISILFMYISYGAFNMLQGIYIKEIHLGEDFLGVLISLRTFASGVAAFPCAFYINKIGKKKAILIALSAVSITTILQGYFQNPILILITAVFQGIALTLLAVNESPFLMQNSDKNNHIQTFSLCFATNTFSTMIGYYSFGYVVDFINSYRYGIIIAGLIGIFSVFSASFIREKAVSEVCSQNRVHIRDLKIVFTDKKALQFLIYTFTIGFGAGLVVPYFNVYLKYKINISMAQLGIIMALSQVAMGIGGLIIPMLVKKFSKVNTIIICQIVSIPFLLLIATPPSILIVSIAFFMRSALMNMTSPVINNMAMELVEEKMQPILSSAINFSGNISRALSVCIAGFIMKYMTNGYEIPYYLTATLYVIATIYFYRKFRHQNTTINAQKTTVA